VTGAHRAVDMTYEAMRRWLTHGEWPLTPGVSRETGAPPPVTFGRVGIEGMNHLLPPPTPAGHQVALCGRVDRAWRPPHPEGATCPACAVAYVEALFTPDPRPQPGDGAPGEAHQ
jgi:hypothetical protein